mgnify:FL=1
MTETSLAGADSQAMARQVLHDRIIGCLFGSALGDAVGLYTEFLSEELSIQNYPERKFILSPLSQATPFRRDAHRNPHHPGEWTDDTDHAMLILLSYLHKDGSDISPQDVAVRLEIWVRQGLRALDTLPLGLGRTVGAIVRSKTYLDNPEAAARKHWANCGYTAAPNGSLMRTHPLGLMCLSKSLDGTFQLAADVSVITHVDPRCIVSCAIGTALIRGLVLNEIANESDIDEVVSSAATWYSSLRSKHCDDAARMDEPDLDAEELHRHCRVSELSSLELDTAYKIGYVYKTLGSGIHTLRLAMRRVTESATPLSTRRAVFEQLITDLIMLGGDADTNACFAGALLGSYLGYSSLPDNWGDGLLHGDWLMAKSEGLCQLLGVSQGSYKGSEDGDTAPDGGREFLSNNQLDEKAMTLQARMAKEETEWKVRQQPPAKKLMPFFKWN